MKVVIDEFGVILTKGDTTRYMDHDKFNDMLGKGCYGYSNAEVLPSNTVCFISQGTKLRLALEYPSIITSVRHTEIGEELMIPTPNIVLVFDCTRIYYMSTLKYEVDKILIFATKRPITSYDDDLYFCPLGNVYNDNRVCWGSGNVSNHVVETLGSLHQYFEAYINTPFNNDLSIVSTKSGSSGTILDHLDGKQEFPEALLAQVGGGPCTLQSIMKKE